MKYLSVPQETTASPPAQWTCVCVCVCVMHTTGTYGNNRIAPSTGRVCVCVCLAVSSLSLSRTPKVPAETTACPPPAQWSQPRPARLLASHQKGPGRDSCGAFANGSPRGCLSRERPRLCVCMYACTYT